MRSLILVGAFVTALAGSATAGTLESSTSVTLWGQSYTSKTYNVLSDLAPGGPGLQPEGATFYNGVLYVTGDNSASETNGYMAAYPLGNLGAAPTAIEMGSTPTTLGGSTFAKWGPEGLTVNTSGAGWGAFAGGTPKFASVESSNSRIGVIDYDLASPKPISAVGYGLDTDDITYIPTSDTFGVIVDSGATSDMRIYTHDAGGLVSQVGSFALIGADDSKGCATISAAFASLLLGAPLPASDYLLVAAKPGPTGGNRLGIFDLSGTLLGGVQNFTGGVASAELEAVAVDEVGLRIFLGDEAGRRVYEISVPEPTTLLALGLLGIAAAARRR